MRRLAAPGLVLALILGSVACSRAPDDDRRVLLVGDSVMNQMAQPFRRFAPSEVDVRNDAVNGSGLLSPWLFDWEQHLSRVLRRYEPDVVVFLFVGNYGLTDRRYTTEDGQEVSRAGSDRFFREWQEHAEALTRAAAEDAEVLWVLPPPMRDPAHQQVVDGLRQGYRAIADEVEGVGTFDAYDVLAEDGAFLARAPGRNGGSDRLRARDGVHLAPAGARRLAVAVEEAVAERH